VDEGFELVCVDPADAGRTSASGPDTLEKQGLARVHEALQHCRWSMAEMKELDRGAGSQASHAGHHDTAGGSGSEDGPMWRGMNDEVLRAFEELAACGSDEEGDGSEEAFERLATVIRRLNRPSR
jgi:hypothetical protein